MFSKFKVKRSNERFKKIMRITPHYLNSFQNSLLAIQHDLVEVVFSHTISVVLMQAVQFVYSTIQFHQINTVCLSWHLNLKLIVVVRG